MLIGVPKEIKNQESRVGLTPASTRELTSRGHQVLVETSAGEAIGLPDEAYAAGASICGDAAEVFARKDMIVKVRGSRKASACYAWWTCTLCIQGI